MGFFSSFYSLFFSLLLFFGRNEGSQCEHNHSKWQIFFSAKKTIIDIKTEDKRRPHSKIFVLLFLYDRCCCCWRGANFTNTNTNTAGKNWNKTKTVIKTPEPTNNEPRTHNSNILNYYKSHKIQNDYFFRFPSGKAIVAHGVRI